MNERDFYKAAIEELVQRCTDSDLLSLIYGLLADNIEAEPSPSSPARVLVMFDERRWAA